MSWFNWLKKNNPVSIGDIVVCIDDRNWNSPNNTENIVFNKKYKIFNVCPFTCHGNSYDIGVKFKDNSATKCGINNCAKELPGIGIHWAGEFRFRKATIEEEKEYYAEQKADIESKIDEAIAVENYEEAAKLKKLIEI